MSESFSDLTAARDAIFSFRNIVTPEPPKIESFAQFEHLIEASRFPQALGYIAMWENEASDGMNTANVMSDSIHGWDVTAYSHSFSGTVGVKKTQMNSLFLFNSWSLLKRKTIDLTIPDAKAANMVAEYTLGRKHIELYARSGMQSSCEDDGITTLQNLLTICSDVSGTMLAIRNKKNRTRRRL